MNGHPLDPADEPPTRVRIGIATWHDLDLNTQRGYLVMVPRQPHDQHDHGERFSPWWGVNDPPSTSTTTEPDPHPLDVLAGTARPQSLKMRDLWISPEHLDPVPLARFSGIATRYSREPCPVSLGPRRPSTSTSTTTPETPRESPPADTLYCVGSLSSCQVVEVLK